MPSKRKLERQAAKRGAEGAPASKYAAKGAPPEYEFQRHARERGRSFR